MTLWSVTNNAGDCTIVTAAAVSTDSGTLVFTDERKAVVLALAPGAWNSVYPTGHAPQPQEHEHDATVPKGTIHDADVFAASRRAAIAAKLAALPEGAARG